MEKGGEALTAAAVSANGETLVSGGPDRTVRVWALGADDRGRRVPDAGQVRGLLPAVLQLEYALPSRVLAVAVAPDGRAVLAGCAEGVYVWRLPPLRGFDRARAGGLALVEREPKLITTPRPVYGLETSADGKTLAVTSDEGVRLWDLRLMRPLTAAPAAESADVRDAAFGPGGRRLALAVGGALRVVQASSGAVVAEAAAAHGGTPIDTVAFAPDGRTLAGADAAGLVKLWRLDGAALTERAALTAHTDAVHALAFSPDGRTLASGGWDRLVVLWDPVSGQERASLADHADRVLHVQFAHDGEALMTAGRDGLVKPLARRGAVTPPTSRSLLTRASVS